jgi:hypothetical protein
MTKGYSWLYNTDKTEGRSVKQKRGFRRAFIYAIIIALLAPASIPAPVHAAGFSDIGGHWAKEYINSAISRGIVKGYTDGTFNRIKP